MNDVKTQLMSSDSGEHDALTLLQPQVCANIGAGSDTGAGHRWLSEIESDSPRKPAMGAAEVVPCNPPCSPGLVVAAAHLLALFARIRISTRQSNPGALHRYLRAQIIRFEHATRTGAIPGEKRRMARFLICTVLDEAVLNSPWGCESAWGKHSLLSLFHEQTSGGERCFAILGRQMRTPDENLEFLELFYICLCLGFEGCYRVIPGGRQALDDLRKRIFRQVRRYRDDVGTFNSFLRDAAVESTPGKSAKWSSGLTAVLCTAILGVAYCGFTLGINAISEPVLAQLEHLDNTAEISTLASPVNSPAK